MRVLIITQHPLKITVRRQPECRYLSLAFGSGTPPYVNLQARGKCESRVWREPGIASGERHLTERAKYEISFTWVRTALQYAAELLKGVAVLLFHQSDNLGSDQC